MDAARFPPSAQASPRSFDGLIVKPFGDEPVVRKRMQLCHAMTTVPSFGQQPLEIHRALGPSATLSQHGRERATGVLYPQIFGLLKEIDELGERNLAAPVRRDDGRNLASLEPPLQGVLGHAEKPGRCCRSHGRTETALDELARASDRQAHVGPSGLLYLPKPQDMLKAFG